MRPARLCALAAALAYAAPSIAAPGAFERAFTSPPRQAQAGVWWRWIDGNITREGLTRDLTEMARKGIRTVDVFDTGWAPSVGPHGMMSRSWRDLFSHALTEAARVGVDVNVVSAAGWGIGGPWISEEHATKRLAYTEVQVQGPGKAALRLPQATGVGSYYRDVAVLAWPERADRPVQPAAVTASATNAGYCGEQNWPPDFVADGDPNTAWRAASAPSPASPAAIEMRYHAPMAIASIYIASEAGAGPSRCRLLARVAGAWQSAAEFELAPGAARRVSITPVTTDGLRLEMPAAHAPDVRLAEFWALREGDNPPLRPGIQWWMFKSGARAFWGYPPTLSGSLNEEYPAPDVCDVRLGDVVDLTSRVSPEGDLAWEAPPGRWTLARFGAVVLGEPPRAMSRALSGGYEADPYSQAAADALFDHTAAILKADAPPQARKALTGILTDSYEIGASVNGFQGTWTDGLRADFWQMRGYDPIPYLPAMACRVLEGRDVTNRFLYDYRQTLSDLYNRFYQRLADRSHALGMKLRAENGYGTYPFPHIDGLAAFGRTDVPMGEFWYNDAIMAQFFSYADAVRTAASAAHIYGKPRAAAESLTLASGVVQAPSAWKSHMDVQFANGLNHCMIHLWSHQYDVAARPGLHTYDAVNANMTWWPMAEGFLGYLARVQAILQQGRFVADACYLMEEGTARFVPSKECIKPALPAGFDFDGINAEVVLTRLKVRGKRLTLPDGLSYGYMALPNRKGWTVSPELLARLRDLVEAGATLVGSRPSGAPGLANSGARCARVRALADQLWGKGRPGIRRVGRGRVVSGMGLAQLFATDRLAPDCDTGAPSGTASVAGAAWIWHTAGGVAASGEVRRFRAELSAPKGRRMVRASVVATADDDYTLSANGRRLLSGNAWQRCSAARLPAAELRNGLKLEATVTNGPAGGPAGLICMVRATLDNGAELTLPTGPDWRSSADGRSWQQAQVIGPYGCGPWGAIAGQVTGLDFIHRQAADGSHAYFVVNKGEQPVEATVRFRVSGLAPSLLHPVTGVRRALPQWQAAGGVTRVPLRFEPHEAYFVLFSRRPRIRVAARTNFPPLREAGRVPGPWQVRFDPKWGGPEQAAFATLDDWTKRPEPGIRGYSGIGVYSTTFDAPPGVAAIDLGTVKETARVRLNGRDLGVVWCPPWRVDLPAGLLKPTGNTLVVEVANLWNNRLITDAALPASQRLTRGNYPRGPSDPLMPSGLLGPVRLLAR